MLDVLLHGQEDVAARARRAGVELMRGDVRDADAAQARARRRRGRRAPGRDRRRPGLRARPRAVQRGQRGGQPRARGRRPRRRAWSASCSPPPARTTAAWPIRPCRSTRPASCGPVSLYAEQKVGDREGAARAATGRRRLRHLPALRDRLRRGPADALRPHRQRVHARPVGRPQARGLRRAVLAPLHPRARRGARRARWCWRSPPRRWPGSVFNAGHSDENYRKLDLVEIITGQLGRGDVEYVSRDEDPRDYKVSFEKIRERARLRAALPRARRHRRARRRARGAALRRPLRRPATRTSADERRPADPAVRRPARADREIDAVADTLRSGWLTMGPRTQEFEAGLRRAPRRASTRSRSSSCTAALHLAYLAAGVGPGDEVIVPAITFVATAAAARYCGATPVLADIMGHARPRHRPRGRGAPDHAAHQGRLRRALRRLRGRPDGAAARSARAGIALIEDAAHSPSATPVGDARKLGTHGLAGCFSFFSNKVLSCGEGGLLATDDDGVADARCAACARTR